MAKKVLSPSTVATNNIQSQTDQVKGQATLLKVAFDQNGIDSKAYMNATHLVELASETVNDAGANAIGAEATFGANNVADEIKAIKVVTDTAVTADVQNVKLTGNQTVAGIKTLTSSPIVPVATTDTQAPQKKYVDDENLKDVHLTGIQTVAGVKTFSSSPVVPIATTDLQAPQKVYVDTLDAQDVKVTGTQTVAGIKTFSSSPIVPAPTTDLQASTKKYADDVGTAQSALLTTHKTSADHDGRYYTETEVDGIAALKANSADVYSKVNMQTTGQSLLHWGNLTNVPAFADNNWKAPVADLTALNALVGMEDGDLRLVLDTDVVYTYDLGTTTWKEIGASGSGISDHGTLIGLSDDDHTQYLRTDGTRALTGNQDFNDFQALDMIIHSGGTAPTSVEGKLWYDIGNHQLKVYNGTAWINTTGVGAVVQDVEVTASAGQTAFDVSDGATQSYNTGDNTLAVYKKNTDGYYELLDQDSYVETSSTVVTLNAGATLNDEMYFKWQKNVASIVDSIGDGEILDVKLSDTAGQIKARVLANTAKVTYPTADSTKVGFITVTQAVDLDAIEITADAAAVITTGTSTITTTGWVANTGDYALKLDLAITGILVTDMVDVVLDKDSLDVAGDAEMASTAESYAGGVTFYAQTAPALAIPFSWKVVR